MKVVNVGKFPEGTEYRYGELEPLSSWDLEELAKHPITHAWYWYAAGSYEGTGQLLVRFDNGKWGLMSMNHCSCYGPLNNFDSYDTFDSLNEIAARSTPDAYREVSDLIDAARAELG